MAYIGRNDGVQSAMAADGEHLTIGGTTGLLAGSKRIPLKVGADGTLAVSTGSSTSTSRANSTAYQASNVVKSSSGTLYDIIVYNSKASTQFIQLFDSVSLPADGTAPVMVFPIATATTVGISFQQGMAFSTGIVVCNSSTANTKTIGSADCYFTANYV